MQVEIESQLDTIITDLVLPCNPYLPWHKRGGVGGSQPNES
jgi:hypothetical protein